MSWRDEAACTGVPLDDLFGSWQVQAATARKVCVSCPVKFECAEQGKSEPHGLWGGIPEGSPGRPTGPATRTPPRPATCSADGCDRPHTARGWCKAHYGRLLVRGDPRPSDPIGVTPKAPTNDGMKVVAEVAAEHGVELSDLLGRKRRYHASRQEAMCRLRDMGWSFPAIGRVFGRDHTTVLAAVRKMERVAA